MPSQKKQKTETEQAVTLPPLYKGADLLSIDQHRDLTVAVSPGGFSFAAELHRVLLAAVEFPEAAYSYPIIFSLSGDGNISPVALLGIQTDENLFVDADGTWKSSYIPAYIRRYPFITVDTGTQQMPICIDPHFDGLNSEGGQRLFTENGEPTDFCLNIKSFVQDYQAQLEITAGFTAKLKELELFRPLDANIQLTDGSTFLLEGLLIVDENRLSRLGDVAVLDLFRKGYLGMIYTHLTSVKNLARLIDMKAARQNQANENNQR